MIAKLWGYLAGLGVLIAGVLGFAAYFKRQGRKDEQATEVEKSLEQAKEANAIDTRVRNLTDSELDEQLRNVLRKK